MLPISPGQMRDIGPLVDRLSANPEIRHWARQILNAAPVQNDQVDLAYALSAPLEREMSKENGSAVLVLAAAMASVGLRVRIEGLCMASPDFIDVLQVLASDRQGNWIAVTPLCGPAKQAQRVHVLNYLPRAA